jgi:hypothetical protein
MNCEAGETESDIERIAGGTAEMPNSHTILGHMRGACWRFIQNCPTNTQLTEEFGPKCGAFVALPAALINAVTSFLHVGTGQSILKRYCNLNSRA